MSDNTQPEDGYSTIIEIGFAFWKSQALITAVGLGLFSALAKGPMPPDALRRALGVHGRGFVDLLSALVSLEMLEETSVGYANTKISDYYLDQAKPTYIGGLLELASDRLYPLWGRLRQGLLTGEPQNEAREEEDYYANLGEDRQRLAQFLKAMDGLSRQAAKVIAERYPWEQSQSFIDLGGARGAAAVELARAHPHLHGGCFELPAVRPYFEEYVAQAGLHERLQFYEGDFFRDPLPPAQTMLLGHVLHNWDSDQKRYLLRKAYDALPLGGGLIVYEWFHREERKSEPLPQLMSLNMLLATRGGGGIDWRQCREWMLEAGFCKVHMERLPGPGSMLIGAK
jgi:hypothetical protein